MFVFTYMSATFACLLNIWEIKIFGNWSSDLSANPEDFFFYKNPIFLHQKVLTAPGMLSFPSEFVMLLIYCCMLAKKRGMTCSSVLWRGQCSESEHCPKGS